MIIHSATKYLEPIPSEFEPGMNVNSVLSFVSKWRLFSDNFEDTLVYFERVLPIFFAWEEISYFWHKSAKLTHALLGVKSNDHFGQF